jgi:hypothetical protein
MADKKWWQLGAAGAAAQEDMDAVEIPPNATAAEKHDFTAQVATEARKLADTHPLIVACAQHGIDKPEQLAQMKADSASYKTVVDAQKAKAKEHATIAFGDAAATDHTVIDALAAGPALTAYCERMKVAADAKVGSGSAGGQRQSASTFVAAADADRVEGHPPSNGPKPKAIAKVPKADEVYDSRRKQTAGAAA